MDISLNLHIYLQTICVKIDKYLANNTKGLLNVKGLHKM